MNRVLSFFLFSLALACTSFAAGSINEFKNAKDREHIDSTIKAFMAKYNIPGLSISLARGDTILLSKGYGVANTGTSEPVTPDHRFRIASVAKPITAVAIFQLIEEGKLSLDDPVFGPDGILGGTYRTRDPNVLKVRVRDLLEHAAGKEWRNEKNDPMFQQPRYNHRALIQWVLDTRTLSRAPGFSYHYSNFGYCLLGQIIEEVTADSYENHIRNLYFPHRIRTLANSRNTPSRNGPEVKYYNFENTLSPYGMPIARMDSHGGLISTSADLVRFLMAVDGRSPNGSLLKPATVHAMTKPSRNNPNYARGWSVNSHNNWWHMGSLPGTSSAVVRTHNGIYWAVLCNARSESKSYVNDLDSLTWNIINGIRNWP